MARGADNSRKDKEMAAYLKAAGIERRTGKCCICYGVIPNGIGAYNHYSLHARGADGLKEEESA